MQVCLRKDTAEVDVVICLMKHYTNTHTHTHTLFLPGLLCLSEADLTPDFPRVVNIAANCLRKHFSER